MTNATTILATLATIRLINTITAIHADEVGAALDTLLGMLSESEMAQATPEWLLARLEANYAQWE